MKRNVESPRPAEADKLQRDDPALHGEGNYKAARSFGKSLKKFIEDGRVDPAARDAAPRSAEEARELEAAEKAGLSRARH